MKKKRSTLFALIVILLTIFMLSACTGAGEKSTLFPKVDADKIPDVLEKTVGTVGDRNYASTPDSKDYSSYITVTFNGTTKEDYDALMAHYASTSTGTDESGCLLFAWGRLKATLGSDSIFIEAYMV